VVEAPESLEETNKKKILTSRGMFDHKVRELKLDSHRELKEKKNLEVVEN